MAMRGGTALLLLSLAACAGAAASPQGLHGEVQGAAGTTQGAAGQTQGAAYLKSPPTTTLPPLPRGPSSAETFTFHVYRAQNNHDFPPENVNVGNLAGTLWYLQHEVVITTEWQPVRKFGIHRIVRYKVQTKAPQNLADIGLNFGVRFAYDQGDCTGPGICEDQYRRFGFFVGCNKLGSFPYPDFQTNYNGGIWYSLPKDGACEAPPTGAADCTYSYEAAGEITLDELEAHGRAAALPAGMARPPKAGFWAGGENNTAVGAAWQVETARKLFREKYGDEGAEAAAPPCDFSFQTYYYPPFGP